MEAPSAPRVKKEKETKRQQDRQEEDTPNPVGSRSRRDRQTNPKKTRDNKKISGDKDTNPRIQQIFSIATQLNAGSEI
jgi:hypothetical protein